MGWLGVDPGRLGVLGRWLAEAAAELAGADTTEPLAADVVAVARHAASWLRTQWVPGVARIVADSALTAWAATPGPTGGLLVPSPPAGSAGVVAAWWGSLSDAQQFALTVVSPATIGNLDGIPAWARDLANRRRLAADLAELVAADEADRLTDAEAALLVNARAVEAALADAAEYRDPRAGEPVEVQLYLYEPAALGGDGRVAIALGDVDRATHLAVLVPGMGTEVSRFGTAAQQAVFTAAVEHTDKPIAVMAWAGYDAPSVSVPDGSDDDPLDDATDWAVEAGDLATVLGLGAATNGARLLADDVTGLRAITGDGAHVSVLGNSYGSTTVAVAADEYDLDADDVILTGSPGAGRAGSAAELTTGVAHTWVGSASDDPVSYLGRTGGAELHDFFELNVAGTLFDIEVGLGNDPAEDDFGARRFQAEWPGRDDDLPWSLAGHGHYFDPDAESLGNVGAIVAGDYRSVRPAEHRHKDETWDPWDPLGDLLPSDPEAGQPVDVR
jgi:hypothetical protein